MTNAMSGSDLAFLLCGITVALGALFVWAISTIERSRVLSIIRTSALRRLR